MSAKLVQWTRALINPHSHVYTERQMHTLTLVKEQMVRHIYSQTDWQGIRNTDCERTRHESLNTHTHTHAHIYIIMFILYK